MRCTLPVAFVGLLALPAAADVPLVVTDIPPVHSLVAQVMGDLGMPEVLVDQGADAHSFQLRPSQARNLSAAKLIIWIGPEMTPWLERMLDGLGPDARQLRLLAVPDVSLLEFGALEDHEAHAIDADHDETHAHDDHKEEAHNEKAHAEDPHDHAGTDPHAWLDPGNAQAWLGAIATELSTLDPENAAVYAANATAAQAAIAAMDAEIVATLAPVKEAPIVVFHDAYAYFAAHYGITIAGSIAMGDAAAPGAAHLRDLQARIGDTPLCIFPEANHDADFVTTLVEGTPARIGAPLDPEGTRLTPGPQLYSDLLRSMAATIADCAAQ